MSNEAKAPARGSRLGITLRTALLAWVVAIITLLIFAAGVLPLQRQLYLDSLSSKAYAVSVSLGEVAATAVVSEDYSSVVDHCVEMLRRDPTLKYIIITRNDGTSLVHTREKWDSVTLDETWRPKERVARGGISSPKLIGERVFAYDHPFDYSGIEWGWIHIGLNLEAYDQSMRVLYRRTALLGALCLVIGFFTSLYYARHLVRPIFGLQRVVRRVAGGDLSVRADVSRQDELGQLAVSVNSMTEALLRRDQILHEANENLEQRVLERTRALQDEIEAREQAHRELAETQRRLIQLSREAGMADVATGILHNVGNVLNSVNVSANLLRDEITADMHLQLLRQTVELLRVQGDQLGRFLAEDPRGRLVLPLLGEIAGEMAKSRGEAAREFGTLNANIEHIKQIIAVQQRYAKVGGLQQQVDPADLFADALSINNTSVERHKVAVLLDYPPQRTHLSTDRHLALQILINLVKNAIQAVKSRPPGEGQLLLRILQTATRTEFQVVDNGVGIRPEDRQKIFQHGFTTRKDGHGFGLHSGSLAARNLGGSLDFESQGQGHGACFRLVLPNSNEKPEN